METVAYLSFIYACVRYCETLTHFTVVHIAACVWERGVNCQVKTSRLLQGTTDLPPHAFLPGINKTTCSWESFAMSVVAVIYIFTIPYIIHTQKVDKGQGRLFEIVYFVINHTNICTRNTKTFHVAWSVLLAYML